MRAVISSAPWHQSVSSVLVSVLCLPCVSCASCICMESPVPPVFVLCPPPPPAVLRWSGWETQRYPAARPRIAASGLRRPTLLPSIPALPMVLPSTMLGQRCRASRYPWLPNRRRCRCLTRPAPYIERGGTPAASGPSWSVRAHQRSVSGPPVVVRHGPSKEQCQAAAAGRSSKSQITTRVLQL